VAYRQPARNDFLCAIAGRQNREKKEKTKRRHKLKAAFIGKPLKQKFSKHADERLHEFQNLSLAGGAGFEPLTPNLGERQVYGFEVDQYRVYLSNLYCKSYVKSQLNNAIKYSDCLEKPSRLLSLKPSIMLDVLKAMICLSKHNGCYEEYKTKLKTMALNGLMKKKPSSWIQVSRQQRIQKEAKAQLSSR
jgi:hypothetical protein